MKDKIIKENEKVIEEKEKEILELKKQLDKKEDEINKLNNEINKIKSFNGLMTVIFYSPEQNIHYSFICKETDIFSLIEKRFYEIYPEFQDSEFVFIANEQKIKGYKTLQENKIKNSQVITLIQNDK